METALYSIGITSSVCLAGHFVYTKLRPHFPVKVNCWFCGQNTVVPFGNSNCWDCLHCEQYNGFQENGDYNKPIPAQYDESLNFPITGSAVSGYKFFVKAGLCSDCNRNQQIKIKLLSEFVPFNEEKFSEEVDAYHCHLEKAYHVCHLCDIRVQKILAKQDSELQATLPSELLDSSKKMSVYQPLPPVSSQRTHFCVHGLSVISLISLIALLLSGIFELQEDSGQQLIPLSWTLISYLPTVSTIMVIGLLTAVGAILFAGRNRLKKIDAVVALLWVVLQAIYSTLISSWIPAPDLHLLRPMLVFCTTCLSVCSYICRFTENSCNQIWMRKRRIKNHSVIRNPSNKTNFDSTANFNLKENNIKKPSETNEVLDAIDQKLDAIRITPVQISLKSLQKLHYKPLQSHYPLVRPTRFTSQHFRQTSWNGSNYWSLSSEKTSPSVSGSSLGLLTPPPSVCSSQESSSASRAGSTCGEEWHNESWETKILTWPPSIAKSNHWESDTNRSSSHHSNTSNILQPALLPQKSIKEENSVPPTSCRSFSSSSYKLAFVSIFVNFALLIYFVILPQVN